LAETRGVLILLALTYWLDYDNILGPIGKDKQRGTRVANRRRHEDTRASVMRAIVRMFLKGRGAVNLQELMKYLQEDRQNLATDFDMRFEPVPWFVMASIMRPESGITVHFDGQVTELGLVGRAVSCSTRRRKRTLNRDNVVRMPLTRTG
jgi:hypothetical protein